jgi:hypothetical protein
MKKRFQIYQTLVLTHYPMKNKFAFLTLSSIAVASSALAQVSFNYEQDFSEPTFANSYDGADDDGTFIRNGVELGGISRVNFVGDDAFSSGDELQNGYKFDNTAFTDFTLPSETGVFDSGSDYTISLNFRSFDNADTDGSVTGNFILGARNSNDSIGWIGKNIPIALDAVDGWQTYTHTVTRSEVDSLGIDGNRIFLRVMKTSGSSGDLMLLDNLSISAIPEPQTFGLLAGVGALFALGLRRRNR